MSEPLTLILQSHAPAGMVFIYSICPKLCQLLSMQFPYNVAVMAVMQARGSEEAVCC